MESNITVPMLERYIREVNKGIIPGITEPTLMGFYLWLRSHNY